MTQQQQQQEHHQETIIPIAQPKVPDKRLKLEHIFLCSYCDKKIEDGIGLFYHSQTDNKTFYFDYYKCRNNFKRKYEVMLRREQRKLASITTCPTCSKEFSKKTGGQIYCSKKCFTDVKPDYYTKFYRCDQCSKWIPKEESIFVPKGQTNPRGNYILTKDRYKCPVCHLKLRTKVRA